MTMYLEKTYNHMLTILERYNNGIPFTDIESFLINQQLIGGDAPDDIINGELYTAWFSLIVDTPLHIKEEINNDSSYGKLYICIGTTRRIFTSYPEDMIKFLTIIQTIGYYVEVTKNGQTN